MLNFADRRRLDRVIRQAAQSPVYRRAWGHRLAERAARLGADALPELPVLTKRDIADLSPAELVQPLSTPGRIAWESTSGSSGQPFRMPIDAASHRRRRWRFLTALWIAGYRPGLRILIVSSQPSSIVARRQIWSTRLGWLFTDLDQPETAIRNAFECFGPEIIYGPLTALLHLGELFQAFGRQVAVRHVISTGEQLTDQVRTRLQRMYNADVTDFYGMTELGLVAWKMQDRHHYSSPRSAFSMEFLPDRGMGVHERLVVTDLHDGILPMVRYDTGDLVRRDSADIDAPILEFVGRGVDALRLPAGTKLSPYRLISALESIAGIEEFQVTQQVDSSVDVQIRCRPDADRGVTTETRAMLTSLCDGLVVRITHGTGPVQRPSGKLRPVRCLISES